MKIFSTLFFCLFTILTFSQNLGVKWAQQLNAVNDLFLIDIETDAQNNVYICGHFNGPFDIDPSSETANLTLHGQQDLFIAKFDSDGNYIWARSMGSFSDDFMKGMDVNDYGVIVLVVETEGEFDILAEQAGPEATLPADGNLIIWMDPNGALYGADGWLGQENYSYLSDMIVITEQAETFIISNNDEQMVKWNSALEIEWQKDFNALDHYSIVCDDFGYVYTTHRVSGTGFLFPETNEGFYNVTGSDYNVMVSKLGVDGNVLWSGVVGGSGQESEIRMSTDGLDKLFLAYLSQSAVETSILGTSALSAYYGGSDVVLSCYNLTGQELWTNVIGGSQGEELTDLAYNAFDNQIYATIFSYPNFDGDPTSGLTPEAGPVFGYEASTGAIATWGDNFLFNSFNGSSNTFHAAPFITCLEDGDIILGDRFYIGVDIAPGNVSQSLNSNFNYDIFLGKYGECQATLEIISENVCQGSSFFYNGNEYYAGEYTLYELNEAGCDRVIQLTITENVTTQPDYMYYTCDEAFNYQGNIINTTGSYQFEWTNDQGCLDSLVSVYVFFVTEPALGVFAIGNNNYQYQVVSPSNVTAQYALVNCENNNTVQEGSFVFYNANGEGAYYLAYDLFVQGQLVCSGQTDCLNTDGTVGVIDFSIDNTIVISPNPVRKEAGINLQSSNSVIESIRVYEVSGRLIYTEENYNPNTPIYADQLTSGVYFLEAKCADHSSRRIKFIVE